MIWTPAKHGCYWYSGEFTIGTQGDGKQWAYVLIRDFEELARCRTLTEAKEAAEAIAAR